MLVSAGGSWIQPSSTLPSHPLHLPPTASLTSPPPPARTPVQDFARLAEVQFLDNLRRGASINYADLQPNPVPQGLAEAYRLLTTISPQARPCTPAPSPACQQLASALFGRGMLGMRRVGNAAWVPARRHADPKRQLCCCCCRYAAGDHPGERDPHPAGGSDGAARQVGAGRRPQRGACCAALCACTVCALWRACQRPPRICS